uniref:Alpha-2-macroglobulin domain-containing protein n=1 Tax=Sparus aurata TaxID=8175 RepID=A0A671UYU7_SPAAU
MDLPELQTRTWTLFVCLSWMFVGQVVAGPQYMVAIPAVVEAGAQTRFCVSLLQPSETLVMTVTLISQEKRTVLFEKTTSTEFHTCVQFQENEVQNLKVEVQGATFHSEEVRKVMIKIYQPDADRNRIGQWLNITSNGKILQLSHSLNSEAREGTYRVTLWINRHIIEQNFKVEKYVLPKFDVKINVPDEISLGQDIIKVEVCAKYTYGQPVPGTVELVMCRPVNRAFGLFTWAPCHKETKQTEKNGCATFMTEMSTFTKADPMSLYNELHLKATGTEEGTGISFLQGKKVKLSYIFRRLSFIDTPKVYDQALILEGKVKAVYFNNTPIPDKLVHLFLHGMSSSRLLQNLTTDSDGIASFSLNTTSFKGNIQLLVKRPERQTGHYETAHHTLSMVQPSAPHIKSVSSLEVKGKDKPLPCEKEETISIQYTIVGETQGSVDVMYLILSRGTIVTQGLKTVDFAVSVTEGEVSFTLKASPEIAPVVQVVAYTVLPSETVIAHSADFSTEKCLSNKVSLEFSPSSAVPGEETTLQVTAQPDSLCGVSVVDQSVLIKEPGKTLDKDKIFDLLPVKKASSFPHDVEDPVSCLNVRQRRYIMPNHDDNSAYGVFKKLGLKMATNLFFRMPSCVNFKGTEYYSHHPCETSFFGQINCPVSSDVHRERETWIWNLVEVGESGTKDVSLTVPDTITTWETEAFCLSPQGFGLAPRKHFTVFQPFFLELSLPYSIIRGEHFELKATTFNYLSSCIMVSVTLAPSSDYTVTPLSGDQYTSCLCANERKTLSWTMIPSVLGVVNVSVTAEAVASHMSCDNEIVSVPERGRIDVVTRPLIVKVTLIHVLFCLFLFPGEALTEEIELLLPENVIDGSARASLSVLGDILGRALKNLDGLLKMPYGCGEQNMALLAPNIYILQYLKNTQQLTTTIKEKATNFLTSGYQRQLNYKHYDGAYSTFGTGVGNTWLTAFVLRSFVKAQSFVYIDPEKIRQTKDWLESKQQENGCFEQSGNLFNNRMKGGVSDEVTLSAYITAAFLEMNMSVTHGAVNRSLSCLNESISDLNNTYTTALLAYVFTLAGDMETRAHLLEQLDKVALNQGGFLHWSQTATETSASLSVEISSYVLLAKLSASPTAEDLAYANRIVRWLTGQQNQYGGFSSTQDTVVALQALALYSTLVFSLEGSSTVTVQSSSGQLTFDVNQDNKLLYQEVVLKDVTGKYSLEVKGTACASMQISLHYNIPTPADVTTLGVKVKPVSSCISQRPKLTLQLRSLYSGKQNSTNMVILDIKMLSGFVPDPQSLQMLKGALQVARIEEKTDHVLVYLQGLTKDIPINHSLQLVQEHSVQNLKPAVVKIYDYYQPSDQAETEYIFSCAAGNNG